jgi:hypothetical protein
MGAGVSSQPCHRRIVLARGGGKLYDLFVSDNVQIAIENKGRSPMRENALARALRENILKRKAQKSARNSEKNTTTQIEDKQS